MFLQELNIFRIQTSLNNIDTNILLSVLQKFYGSKKSELQIWSLRVELTFVDYIGQKK